MAARKRSIIGLAFGEASLLAAELSPEGALRATAEFPFPPSLDAKATGKALGDYLKSKGFSARTAVAGLAARKLAVKAKEVPPADRATLNELLRLQAEGEFAAELKELVYDYEGQPSTPSVMLMATPKANLDFIQAVTEGAGLSLAAVLPTAVALGHAVVGSGRASDALVLSTFEGAGELVAMTTGRLAALRTVRTGAPGATGELKRAILPIRGSARELTVFGDTLEDPSLVPAPRRGELSSLGLTSPGEARFAPAVALALAGQGDELPVDFLHSKLAPPKERKIPRWAIAASLAAVLLIGGVGYAWYDLSAQQAATAKRQADFAKLKPSVDEAKIFVDNASIAQGWHNAEPRYLECLREVTATFPEDGQSFGINLTVREAAKPTAAAANAAAKKTDGPALLICTLAGKTNNARQAQSVIDAFGHSTAFTNVKSLGTADVGRGQMVSFSLSFNYKPAPPATQPAGDETFVSSPSRDNSNSSRSNRTSRNRRSE